MDDNECLIAAAICDEFGHSWCEAQAYLGHNVYKTIGYVCLVCWDTSVEDPR